MLTIIRKRTPKVKDYLVQAAIVFAYGYANHDNRLKYASIFSALTESSSSPMEPQNPFDAHQLSSQDKLISDENTGTTDTLKGGNYDPRVDYRFMPHVTFPKHGTIKHYSWRRAKTFLSKSPHRIYLNPKLLDEFERMYRGPNRVRILVLIHCVVCHEIAHLLHFKIYNSVDPYFEKSSDVDYGTEIEYQLFDGKMLVTADLTKMRIERRDGTKFEVDPVYIWKEYLKSNHRRIDFGELTEVGVKDEDENQRWLGMGEINGTHDRLPCEEHC